jgi:hypothetical protein
MHDLWPSRERVVAMPGEELSLHVLGLLASPDLRACGIGVSRRAFVGGAATHYVVELRRAAGEDGTIVVHSDDAITLLPDVARAFGEAWDTLAREGLIAEQPGGGAVYVTAAGRARLRGQARSPDEEPAQQELIHEELSHEESIQEDPAHEQPAGELPHDDEPERDAADRTAVSSPELAAFLAGLGIAAGIAAGLGASWWVAITLVVPLTILFAVALLRLAPLIHRTTASLTRASRLRVPARLAVGAALALLCVGAGWLLVRDAPERPSLTRPPEGWFTNASSGKASPPRRIVPTRDRSLVTLERGDIFYACNDSVAGSCEFSTADDGPVTARRGDRIRLRMRLHVASVGRISLIKVRVDVGPGVKPRTLEAHMWLDSPSVGNSITGYHDAAIVHVPDDQRYALEYVPESTRLLGSTYMTGGRRTLALLPEGIVGRSVVLTHVGPPAGCWNCDLEYIRFVDFLVRVV